MPNDRAEFSKSRPLAPMPSHERHFYSAQRAFGLFRMRIFDPVLMGAPHLHGLIEATFAIDMEMTENLQGQNVQNPDKWSGGFWGGVWH